MFTLWLFPLGFLLQFINRNLFIHFLGIYYLGLNGVFSSILGVLSLAELGVGASIIFALYKPVAKQDHSKIAAYMQLYQKIYRFIALVIFALGLVILPFLKTILQVESLSQEVIAIYLLFLANSVIGYLLFAYKRSLLIVHQETYIISGIEFIILLFTMIIQWGMMALTHHYILILCITILSKILSNVVIAYIVTKRYPMKDVVATPLTQEEKQSLKKNVLGNLAANISFVIVFSTDNILMSSFISVAAVGLYSNYTMITKAFDSLLSQLMSSQNASVGNLIHTSSSEKIYDVFKRYNFLNFALSFIGSLLIFVLINPFITLWIGKDYLLSSQIVLLLSMYVFMQTYRYSGFIFYSAYGLYWESRYKPIVEAVLNLVFSLLFLVVFKWGVSGILVGTICSTLLTNTWFEPYIIFKYGLKRTMKEYIWINIQQWLVYFVTLFGLYFMAPQRWFASSFLGWFQLAIVAGSSLTVLLLVVFHKNKTLRWWVDFVRTRLIKKRLS